MLEWSECWFEMRRRGREKEKVALEECWCVSMNTTFRTVLARLVMRKNEFEVGGLNS